MLELRPKDQDGILTLLEQFVPQAEVWAFGSRVAGQSHPGSDLDLVVRPSGDPEATARAVTQLRRALSDSNVAIQVDVFDWDSLPESFRREIERAHVVFRPGGTRESA